MKKIMLLGKEDQIPYFRNKGLEVAHFSNHEHTHYDFVLVDSESMADIYDWILQITRFKSKSDTYKASVYAPDTQSLEEGYVISYSAPCQRGQG